ncbi:adhesin [Streptomyces sp. NPDC057445]|uniref:adhesin n=1 Tax=Streptomyces sp. NPDC057445 TaxID=3346136 RepID=UPI0036B872FA
MVCERCGGTHRGALPGMVTETCTVDPPRAERRVIEPFPGRGTLLTAGVVVALGGLLLGVLLLTGEDSHDETAGEPLTTVDDLTLGGLPDRVGPTFVPPDSPSPSATSRGPSPSVSPSPSATKRNPSHAAGPGPSPSAPRRPAYSEWAGPGCPNGVRTSGRYSDGPDGWYDVYSGGHTGDSCDGSFIAVPMSGAADRDSGGTVTWNWRPGPAYTKCSVAVRIPWSPRDEDVAGDPTRYNVLSGPGESDDVVMYFGIDQRSMRGGVVVVNDLLVREGELTVQLVDRGQDWGRGYRDGAHHAAAQIRADCVA